MNFGYVNSWSVLMIAMIALTPPLPRKRRHAAIPAEAFSWRPTVRSAPVAAAASLHRMNRS
jgi:hypothetical protein